MSLVVEDGTGLATAESYISVADAATYLTAAYGTAPASWTAATTATKEAALRAAARWIDARYSWPGQCLVLDPAQALAWPRAGAIDREGRTVDAASVPQRIKDSTCEAAILHLAGTLVTTSRDRGGMVKRVKVGELEKEYADGAPGGRTYPWIDQLLAGLALFGGGGAVSAIRLVRV